MFNPLKKLGVFMLFAAVLGLLSMFSVNTFATPPLPGTVVSVYPGTTAHGIKLALAGAPGTALYMRDNLVIFTWTVRDQGVAFGMMDLNTLKAVSDKSYIMHVLGFKGNMINCADAGDMIKAWLDHGWKPIVASDLVAKMSTVAPHIASEYYTLSSGMTTMLFLPAGVVYDNQMLLFMQDPVVQ